MASDKQKYDKSQPMAELPLLSHASGMKNNGGVAVFFFLPV